MNRLSSVFRGLDSIDSWLDPILLDERDIMSLAL